MQPRRYGSGWQPLPLLQPRRPQHEHLPPVEEDIGLDRIRHNEEGRIVLPGSGFVPRLMAGNNMREQVMNWHQNFPGHASVNMLTPDPPAAPQPMF